MSTPRPDPVSIDATDPSPHRDSPLEAAALDRLFRGARTYSHWQDRPVDPLLLHRLHGLLRWGPTSMNCQPARFVFVTSAEAKARLLPCLMEGNRAQTASAPVTVIVFQDGRFYDRMPDLWPGGDVRPLFESNETLRTSTAFRNASLQAGYLILAARALGLDCGPMSGFDPQAVAAAFGSDQPDWEATMLCNLGYGDPSFLHPRAPRPDFESVCRVV